MMRKGRGKILKITVDGDRSFPETVYVTNVTNETRNGADDQKKVESAFK
jgi:hypothetical protein